MGLLQRLARLFAPARVEVWLTLDQNRKLTDRQISGGVFIEAKEER